MLLRTRESIIVINVTFINASYAVRSAILTAADFLLLTYGSVIEQSACYRPRCLLVESRQVIALKKIVQFLGPLGTLFNQSRITIQSSVFPTAGLHPKYNGENGAIKAA